MDLAEEARAAYILGWAESGGPLTDRVKAGCTAAVACCDSEALLEATLHIGRLEGQWALIFSDREEVHDHHGPKIDKAWRALLKAAVDVPAMVAAYLGSLRPEQTRAERRDLAQMVAASFLRETDAPWLPEYTALVTALTAAIDTAEKAGMDAGRLLIGPHEDAPPPPPPDASHDHKVLALAALALIRKGATRDTANALVGLDNTDLLDGVDLADADPADVEAAVEDGFDQSRASNLYGDQTIGGSFLQGMVAAFVAAGLEFCDWVTAGDARVCARCDELEANGPYLMVNAPADPHPRCRCILSPH